MPNAHNGYYDVTLEMGYVGYYLCLIFFVTTLHAMGRVVPRDPIRAWLLLSLALYIICFNYLESLWMRGYEFLWVVLLIVSAETGRYWGNIPQKSRRYGLRIEVTGGHYKTADEHRRSTARADWKLINTRLLQQGGMASKGRGTR